MTIEDENNCEPEWIVAFDVIFEKFNFAFDFCIRLTALFAQKFDSW